MTGYVKLHRDTFEHELFRGDEYSRREAWIWIISHAAWKPHKYRYQKKMVPIDRGSLPAGRDHLAKAWGWGEQRVRTFLKELKNEKMITTSTNQGVTVVSVCNYDEYQNDNPQANQPDNQPDNQQLTSVQPAANHTEEGKEGKEEDIGTNVPLLTDLDQPTPTKPKLDRQPIVESFNAWQETAQRCGLRQAKALTPAMRKSIGARLREYGADGWRDCLANIERSSFLCGENDREWRVPGIAWVLKPANFEKIVSGTYLNGRHAGSGVEISKDRIEELARQFEGNA